MWFSVKRKEFCQRLVATAEGLFASVCLITRPARRKTAGSVIKHTAVKGPSALAKRRWKNFFLSLKITSKFFLLNLKCGVRISTPKEPLYIKGRGCAPRISEMTLIKLLKVPESYLCVSGNNWCLPLKSTNLNTKNWKIPKIRTPLSMCSRG